MAKLPKLEHVKYVRARGRLYAYFNTGQKKMGRTIYVRLPDPSTPGFYDSWAAMRGARTKRQTVAYTIAAMASDYENSPIFEANARNTQKLYTKTLRRITKLLGEYPVNDLERADIQLVLDNEMAGPGAHNIFLGVLAVLYKWGRERDKTTLEPTKGIARLKVAEHEPWPDAVLEAALGSDDDLVRLAVHLLYFTGQRIGDVCAMRWSDIRDQVLNIVQQKTGKEVWVPLHTELQAELAGTPKRGLTILATEAGLPFRPEAIRAKLQEFTAGHGRKTVPHGLRKNAVIALLEAGCSVAETGSITGQTYKIVEHYARRINQRRMAEAAVIKLENNPRKFKRVGKQGSNDAE